MTLTDNPADRRKFVFTDANVTSTIMNPGDYMLLYGDLNTYTNHLGFALRADGEGLYLYDKDGVTLIDSVEFGPQINYYSIGRVGYDRRWKLNKMTFSPPNTNIAQPLGNPDTLKINEWLANGQVLFDDDFIELYNPHPLPVSLSGMYLTDDPVTETDKHQIVALSFIAPEGYSVFRVNDGNDPWELDFKLSAKGEMIGLFDGGMNEVDHVLYGPQTTDVSEGRAPDGAANYEFFELPTPGVTNPSEATTTTISTVVLAAEDADKRAIVPLREGHIDEAWNLDTDFNDSNWAPCIGSPGGVGYEVNSGFEHLITLDVREVMYEKNSSCYVRIPFTVDGDDLADFTDLVLKVRYDDGFVAYINGGPEVCRRNFSGMPVWNSNTGSSHEAGAGPAFDEEIDISIHIDKLRAGENVLAIQAINRADDSSDFIISVELQASVTSIDHGDFPFPEAFDLLSGLRITELMYNSDWGPNYDYIELQNIGETPLGLGGIRFVEGIEFVFDPMQLDPGQCVVVVSSVAAFRSRYGYGINIAGAYSGGLSGRGEDIVLQLFWPLEAAIMRFEYDDIWYPTTSGGGDSLTIIDPTAHPATWDDAESWQAATPSPGAP